MKVLISRYGYREDLLPSISLKYGCSNLRKGVCQAWPHVCDKFFTHSWLPRVDYLSSHALVPLVDNNLQAAVVDFALEDGNWDWQHLLTVLLANICEFVVGMAPPTNMGISDTIAWLGSILMVIFL